MGWSLHNFCDASGYAYGAVDFLRCEDAQSVTVQLLQAKARVAPLKKASIPRLELLACDIGSRLSDSVCEALNLKDISKQFWTDSKTALAWVKRNDEWRTFVGNRVRSILRLSKATQWRHVPGQMNPADLPSRGCMPAQLVQSKWWEGPSWLKHGPQTWHGEEPEANKVAVQAEKKTKVATMTTSVNNTERPWYMARTSGYSKIVFQMAYVYQFVEKVKKISATFTGDVTCEELERTEKKILKIVQDEAFQTNTKFRGLDDDEGILRVSTKLLMREDSFDFRCPILLPGRHPLVEELIREKHLKSSHGGAQYLIAKLREKLWILQTRKNVNRIIHKCARCQRFGDKPVTVTPAPLPENRVRDAAAFEIVGVDLAGPLYLKERKKVWIVLYTCAVYRAIHLELVASLDTDSFLQSLRRFIARRGRPRVVYSDNGTNFRGSVNLFRAVDWEVIRRKFLIDPIQWIFSPPTASWWNGFFERLVRSVKGLLVRMLGKSTLKYEELLTALCDVEAVINNRPLTYVTEDGQDLVPLTPAMFLQGVRATGVPEIDAIDKDGFQKRFEHRQNLIEGLRGRFRKEYLGILLQKSKDDKNRRVGVGDVVYIANDFKKRIDWQMGKVVELIPGKDKNVRVAKVKTSVGELTRPLQRLVPAEVSSEDPVMEKSPEENGALIPTSRFGRKLRKPDRLRSE